MKTAIKIPMGWVKLRPQQIRHSMDVIVDFDGSQRPVKNSIGQTVGDMTIIRRKRKPAKSK